MLRNLTIRDYAIIDELELEFDSGFTVLTGETGAGKSILVEALGLVLGDRADTGAVRHGAERAEITAEFDLDGATAAWLREHDLADGECILRRVVGADGRSRGFVNGTPAPLTLMRELGERLVDIHGQHEHQSLVRRDAQLALVDAHGGHQPALQSVTAAYDAWHEADRAWRTLNEAASERAHRIELLRFQVRELESLGLKDGELEELDAEHARLANADRLLEGVRQAATLADADDAPNLRGMLKDAVDALDDVVDHDPSLAPVRELLSQASILVGESATDLNRWLERFEVDPQRFEFVTQRIGTAHQLARKHRVEPGALAGLATDLAKELDDLDHADERLAELERERTRTIDDYRKSAAALAHARKATAGTLGKDVTGAMQSLGMRGGSFAIEVATDPDRFDPTGTERVEFTVTANAGQPLRPLAKVASGGELSRISLAFQVTAAEAATIGCLIFDEVDAGIGGAVAEIVGRELRRLSGIRQVLVVTHLPQVASQADVHLRVAKKRVGGDTRTRVERLTDDARIEELARMLGGVQVTDRVRATAREMLGGA